LPPQDLKGFRAAVKVYEVPWRPPGAPPLEEMLPTVATTAPAAVVGVIQRGRG
jgi:hypothetical protein